MISIWILSNHVVTEHALHVFKHSTFLRLCQPVNKKCHIDGLVRDCSNSIANTLELLQSCTKLSMSTDIHQAINMCFV